MPHLPEIPFLEGDVVQMLDHDETRENESYAHLIGEVGRILNPRASNQVGREEALIDVEFDNGERETIFHWRCFLVKRRTTWEV
jgi:hypothetical protein